MKLEIPPLAPAEPGRPITAQAWNAITDAITALYEALNAIEETARLKIRVRDGDTILRDARVVAQLEDRSLAAVLPYGSEDRHTIAGLVAGDWTLQIQALGYKTATVSYKVPGDKEIEVVMERDDSVKMPDLFGEDLKSAMERLLGRGLQIQTILDTTGKEVPKVGLNPAQAKSTVLSQLPVANGYVSPELTRVRLVVGAEVRTESLVAIPDLAGKTLVEARALLKAAGLELGQVGYLK